MLESAQRCSIQHFPETGAVKCHRRRIYQVSRPGAQRHTGVTQVGLRRVVTNFGRWRIHSPFGGFEQMVKGA